ncbi:alpha-mannosidase [Streptomyces johnsoniae]|uniref:Glycoside hydrolase family 38 C-terminal domain-containing protein n=1 Tax=Streptomyces johnsoniae TaxID=3075532 RepID=A0ABU2S8A6_9ACTN|nr:glycoside hydrolase family 38 C-terminal domain-containing protein [Streptomyces sp. DSM 41886]MDT0445217.1 glycoside hydrolase family 38 C-terminal domain-containing protein [Streptomyces sp. DSM 41886]
MHRDPAQTERRLHRVLTQRLWPAVHRPGVPLDVAGWAAPGEPVPVADGIAAPYRPMRAGEPWGPAWATHWFRISGTVPREWAGRRVEAVVDLGFDGTKAGFSAEGLVHLPDGTPLKALNPRNAWLTVAEKAAGGEEFTFHVEAAANPLILDSGPGGVPFLPTGLGARAAWLEGAADEAGAPLYRLARAELTVFQRDVWELCQDLDVLSGLVAELPAESTRRWQVLHAVERALDAVDLQDIPGTAPAAREALAAVLAAPAPADAHRISAVGHAHIDTAWLWPLRETVRKAARTVANVTALMDDHPAFRFVMSQAQQLAWLKEQRPEVYRRAREKAAAGQFLPAGSLWVEPDTNLTGGESLARQFVHGKRFYLEEFGVETEEMWLPDTFGYNAALPQLMKLAGVRWFMTQKISWNRTNTFPHHTFWWEGIDGTRVFSHFPPVDTYNAELSGQEIAHSERNFKEKGPAGRSLVPFGWGDGGGGPTREMLGRAERLADLAGSPRVTVEGPADFFEAAHREYGARAPVWSGELYLELHRGTLTTQLATKQGNRRAEHLLREAELWSATAALRVGAPYPYEDLDRLWKTVLTHQFHDILPGSSIAWVHREAEATYAAVAAELNGLVERALAALAGPAADEGAQVAFNAAPHARGGVPALGGAVADPAAADGGVAAERGADGELVLDNGLLRVTVDGRGLVTSLRDLATGREALPPGSPANLLQLHQDFPNQWDAWDIDDFYRNTVRDLTEADEVAPAADGIRVVRTFGDSRVEQLLTLRRGTRRLDVDTVIDWQEREKLLKAAFPLDLRAEHSRGEIPFGHQVRPTHANTSWDAAKFEFCAHRWLHVEEPGFGVALVNDSSYGHEVTRDVRADGGTTTTLRLSLLRAPRFPDPDADRGRHRLAYALVVGASLADAVREGYRFNLPERRVPGTSAVPPVAVTDHEAVVIEAVKLADDRSGDLVVRLYEALGGRATATLRVDAPGAVAVPVDLLERPLPGTAPLPGPEVPLHLRPFEILTLRITTP